MNAANMVVNKNMPEFNTMQIPFAISLVFHISLAVFGLVVFPLFKFQPPVIEDTPISVEIMDISELAQTNKTAATRPVNTTQPRNTAEAPPKPVQPTVTAEAPPKPVAPTPPEKIQEPAPEPPKPQDVPEPIAKPEPPKAKPKPPEPKPEPKKEAAEAETKPQEKPVEQPNEAFQSVLRNLMPADEEQALNHPETKPGERSPVLTRPALTMTSGEFDALKRQLSHCWSIQAGARYAEDLIVTLKLFVNADRTVRDVRIVDQIRYTTDSFFRAAADSAVRAVYKCSPLEVPPNKHELWNTITINFDPSEML